MMAKLALQGIDRITAILLGGALLNAIAFFAVLPFGTIYLADVTTLSTASIGAVVGSVALIGAFGGAVGGWLSARFGSIPIMIVGLTVNTITYVLLGFWYHPVGVIFLFVLLGVGRALLEPAAKELLSSASDADGSAFRYRYMTLCIGAIVGPLLGGLLYTVSTLLFFLVPAMLFGAYACLILSIAGTLRRSRPTQGAPSYRAAGIAAAITDVRLICATLGGLAVFFVFSQFESILPLQVRARWDDEGAKYFAGLLIANAILALVLQPLIVAVSEKLRTRTLAVIGALAFVAAFAFFGLIGSEWGYLFLLVGVVFWTVGEGVLLPLPDIAIHQVAPEHSRAIYFGVAEFRYAGFFIGPVIGGLLIGSDTGKVGFSIAYAVVMAIGVFLAVPLLLAAFRGSNKTTMNAEVADVDR